MWFSGIARIFGQVEVKSKDGIIIVTGIPAKSIMELIAKWLKTKRFEQHFFVTLKSSYFAFYEFYALEVRAMLQILLDDPRTTYRQRNILRKIITGLEEESWLKKEMEKDVKPILDFGLLSKLSWTPKPHQLEALKVFSDIVPRYSLKGFYIAAQPGTGKTFYDICVATTIIPQSVAEVKIVISPKNAIVSVWHQTVKSCFKKAPKDWVSDHKGDPPLGREYYIFHYEALDRAIDFCKKLNGRGIKYFVIIDEAHNFNSLNSKRTKALIEICQHAKGPYSIWASGSPIKALGSEIVPILKSIDPMFTDKVEPGFLKIFGGVNTKANEIVGKRFGLISHKIPSSVVGEIPKPTPFRVPVKVPNEKRFYLDTVRDELRDYIRERIKFYKSNLAEYRKQFDECLEYHRSSLETSDQRDAYNAYYKDLKFMIANAATARNHMDVLSRLNKYEEESLIPSLPPQLKKQFNDVKTIIKALELKVSGEAIGNIYTARKAECSAELGVHAKLDEIINNGLAKTLIFSNWTEPLVTVEKHLNSLGFKTGHVYGKDSKNVDSIVKKFHEDEDVNPLLATYKALSTAVPVTAANQVVLIDYPYREYIYSQTTARAARIGQKHPVFVFELYLDTGKIPNVSTRGIDIIEFSRTQCAEILGEEFGGFVDEDYETYKGQTANLLKTLPLQQDEDHRKTPKVALGVLSKALGVKA